MNVMCASDYVIIPVEASPWGLFGLANMFEFIDKVKEISPRLDVMGIMVTRADERKNYFKETLKTLKETEGVRVFEEYVKVDSTIEWSQDNSKPVVAYKKYSRSALEYKALAKEVIEYANR
jgi:chromosome partitioning protein